MSQAPLERLPPELRQLIYSFCLHSSTAKITTSYASQSTWQDLGREKKYCSYQFDGLGLFRANRTLREESVKYIRAVNMFVAVVCYGSLEFVWGGDQQPPLVDSLVPVVVQDSEDREPYRQFDHCMAEIRIWEPAYSLSPPDDYWHCCVIPASALTAFFSHIYPRIAFEQFEIESPLTSRRPFEPMVEMSVCFASRLRHSDVHAICGGMTFSTTNTPTRQQQHKILDTVCHFYPIEKLRFDFPATEFDTISSRAIDLPLFQHPLPASDILGLVKYYFNRHYNRKQVLDMHALAEDWNIRLSHLVDEYDILVEEIQKSGRGIREMQALDGWPNAVQTTVSNIQQEVTNVCQQMTLLRAMSLTCLAVLDLHYRSVNAGKGELVTCRDRCPCKLFSPVTSDTTLPNRVKLRLNHLRSLFHFCPRVASVEGFDDLRQDLKELLENTKANGLDDRDLDNDIKTLQNLACDDVNSNLTREMRRRARDVWPKLSIKTKPQELLKEYSSVDTSDAISMSTLTGHMFEIDHADCLPNRH